MPLFAPDLSAAAAACFTAMPQCIRVLTLDGRLVFINPAGLLALEIGGDLQWRGRPCSEIWPGGPLAELRASIDRAMAGEPATFPSCTPASNGASRWWENTLSPLRNADGVVERILWVAHDVSAYKQEGNDLRGDIKQREATLSALSSQLADESRRLADMRDRVLQDSKAKLLGEFVGNVVHDINNVLTVLSGAFTLVVRRAGPALSPDIVAAGHDAIARGSRLVRQMLDFARQDGPANTSVSVSRLIEENATMLAALIGPRIRLELSPAETDWPLTVGAGRLEGVIFNLAANARDAMPDGGTLRIAVRNSRGDALPDELPPGDYVRLDISDTGVGMSPETLARAGRPFFTTKPRGSGTGLGLASAFELASSLGGCVKLSSTPGQGSTVSLVMARAGVRTAPMPAGETSSRLHGDATVLLVDRDDGARLALAQVLRELGYAVIEAASTEMALGFAVSGTKLDLLIYDADTGRHAGFGLTEQLHRDRAALPVIHLRSATEPSPPPGEIWLRKPVYEPLLVRTVLEQLGRLPAMLMTPGTLQASERLRGRLSNAALRDLFDQWHAVSHALGRLPAPAALPKLVELVGMPNAFLVAVQALEAGNQFRIVRIGPELTERLGRDITGTILGPAEQDLLGSQRQAYARCARGIAYVDYAQFSMGEERNMRFERLLVPMSDDNVAVTHMLGMVSIAEVGKRR